MSSHDGVESRHGGGVCSALPPLDVHSSQRHRLRIVCNRQHLGRSVGCPARGACAARGARSEQQCCGSKAAHDPAASKLSRPRLIESFLERLLHGIVARSCRCLPVGGLRRKGMRCKGSLLPRLQCSSQCHNCSQERNDAGQSRGAGARSWQWARGVRKLTVAAAAIAFLMSARAPQSSLPQSPALSESSPPKKSSSLSAAMLGGARKRVGMRRSHQQSSSACSDCTPEALPPQATQGLYSEPEIARHGRIGRRRQAPAHLPVVHDVDGCILALGRLGECLPARAPGRSRPGEASGSRCAVVTWFSMLGFSSMPPAGLAGSWHSGAGTRH